MVDSLEDILVVDNLAAVADLGMMDVLVDYLYADLVMGEPGDYRVPDHSVLKLWEVLTWGFHTQNRRI